MSAAVSQKAHHLVGFSGSVKWIQLPLRVYSVIVPPPPHMQSMPISHMKQLTVCSFFLYTINFIPVMTQPWFGA